jgi:DNA-binding FadR family transcriptional regulator
MQPQAQQIEQRPDVSGEPSAAIDICLGQFAAAATANATLRIENRLARWIVMCSDRIGSEIPVVHEDLSTMLSVRRPGVTEAVRHLEKAGLIAARRGFVRVVDRERLVDLSMGARTPVIQRGPIWPPSAR